MTHTNLFATTPVLALALLSACDYDVEDPPDPDALRGYQSQGGDGAPPAFGDTGGAAAGGNPCGDLMVWRNTCVDPHDPESFLDFSDLPGFEAVAWSEQCQDDDGALAGCLQVEVEGDILAHPQDATYIIQDVPCQATFWGIGLGHLNLYRDPTCVGGYRALARSVYSEYVTQDGYGDVFVTNIQARWEVQTAPVWSPDGYWGQLDETTFSLTDSPAWPAWFNSVPLPLGSGTDAYAGWTPMYTFGLDRVQQKDGPWKFDGYEERFHLDADGVEIASDSDTWSTTIIPSGFEGTSVEARCDAWAADQWTAPGGMVDAWTGCHALPGGSVRGGLQAEQGPNGEVSVEHSPKDLCTAAIDRWKVKEQRRIEAMSQRCQNAPWDHLPDWDASPPPSTAHIVAPDPSFEPKRVVVIAFAQTCEEPADHKGEYCVEDGCCDDDALFTYSNCGFDSDGHCRCEREIMAFVSMADCND